MASELPEAVRKLADDTNLAHVATLMADGSPHVSAVWLEHDGKHIIFNTAEGRVKPKAMRRDPRVAVSIINQQNPYESVTIRGRVVEITSEGADDHINKLAKKYLNEDVYPFRQPGDKRLIVKIEADHVTTMP